MDHSKLKLSIWDGIMNTDILKTIKKGLEKFETKKIKIDKKPYELFLVPELMDDDLNLYEGFILIETDDRKELSTLKNYIAPVSGYAPRIAFVIYDEKLLIKDYRSNKHIIRSLKKINKSFENKIKRALSKPTRENLESIFDRKDIIEEFYILFNKTRDYLADNIKGIIEENRRLEFADNFLMQMMTLWYLQSLGFFNNDQEYMITKFKETKQKTLDGAGFKSYQDFLSYFFNKIGDTEGKQFYEDEILGKVVVIGPAIFIGTEEEFKLVEIPDKCFYQENITEKLITEDPKKLGFGIPIFNLFESRDWIEGDIDEYVLGALYEKLITADVRKRTGSYYTPEKITSYIAQNTIEPCLLNSINEKFNTNFNKIDQVIEESNPKILKYLFNELKDIRILDPAVGSGHFLESAIDVLVNIYQKLRDKAKIIGLKGFNIIVADEKGHLEEIDLLEIDQERFNLYLKFFIILSKNIYGVDINPSAVKIAQARLFLSMAKHFRPRKGENIFIRFPNVHFNLRVGNSLIGYERLGKDKIASLDEFYPDTKYIAQKINILKELEDHLKNSSKILNIKEDIIQQINNLNKLLAKNKLTWPNIKEILKTKENLVKILIASLNSKYATPIDDLISRIDELFYKKLDEKFSEEHEISLKKIDHTFHWILEFPEVFLKKDGFDIVIGNPPYVRQEKIKELKEHLERNYEAYNSTADLYVYFFEKSIKLLRKRGIFSFISSNKYTRAKYGNELRKYLKRHKILKYNDYTGKKIFKGVTVDTSIIIIEKNTPEDNHKIKVNESFHMPQEHLDEKTWIFEPEEVFKIKEKMEKVGRPLKEWNINIYRGVLTGFNEAFIISGKKRREILDACRTEEERKKTEKIIRPVLRGRDVGRYFYDWKDLWVIGTFPSLKLNIDDYPALKEYLMSFGDRLKQDGKPGHRKKTNNKWFETQDTTAYYHEFEKEKIVWQEIVRSPSFAYDDNNIYIEATAFLMTGERLKYILGLLNSRPVSFFFKTYYAGGGLGEGYRYKKAFLERLPIPPITKENKNLVEKIEGFVDQILVLNKQRQFLIKSFKALVENIGQGRMNSPLGQYLKPKNAPDYSINLVETKRLIDDEKMGLPRFYKVKGYGDSLIISVGYDDGLVEDVIQIAFEDLVIKEFFHLAIASAVEGKKKAYRSQKKVLDVALSDIKFPKFIKDGKRDVGNIKSLMQTLEKEYEKALEADFNDSPIKSLSLQVLEDKIREIDEKIDQIVYEVYGLDENEIKVIEKSLN